MNKFGAQKQGSYDSKIEGIVYQKFGVLQEAGLISGLRRNKIHFLIIPEISEYVVIDKTYKTKVKGIEKVKRIEKKKVDEQEARYTPDFLYYDCETNEYVMLEVKSYITKKQKDYGLRRKLIKHVIRQHNGKGRGQWRFEEINV